MPLSGEPVQASWLLFPAAVGLQWLFGTGVALVVARLVAQFRDVKQLVPFVLRVLMYVSGVFFSIDHYVGSGQAAAVLTHQPVAIYLELGRASLLTGVTASASTWLWGLGWAVATCRPRVRVLLARRGEVRPWLTTRPPPASRR